MKDRDSRHSGFKLIVKKKMLMSEPVKEVPFFTDVLNMPDILFDKYWLFLHASVRRFTYSFPTPGFIGFAQYSDVKCLTMQQIDPFSLAEMFILYSAPHTLRVTHTHKPNKHIKQSESA